MNQDNPPEPEAPAEHPPAIPEVTTPAVVPEPPVRSTTVPAANLASPTAVPVRVPASAQFAPPRRSGNIRLVALAALVVLVGWLVVRPHANRNEQLASQVTIAIENNDMRPVEKEFNALNRPELENRVRVARLSDQVVALGKLKSVKEDTPQGAPAGSHHFTEVFERGTWVVDMTIDADGKIGTFNIHPPSVPQP